MGREENEGKTHAYRADRAAHMLLILIEDVTEFRRLRSDVGDAPAPEPATIA